MVTKKISELPYTKPSSEASIPFLQQGVNYAAPAGDFAHLMGGIAPFHNMIADASILSASTTASTFSVVYIEKKSRFAAQVGDAFYDNWPSRHLYLNDENIPHNRIYIDLYNQPYYFSDTTRSLTPIALTGTTSSAKANTAVKELFLSDSTSIDISDSGLYLGLLFRRWNDTANNLIKCQLAIYDENNTIVAQFFDAIDDPSHNPPAIVEIKPQNNSSIHGWAVVNWNAVSANSQWYNLAIDGKAYLNPQCFCLEANPVIYINSLTQTL